MNIILSAYSTDAFKEYRLPSLNNADYSITLRSDFFHLKKNLILNLEVMDDAWSFKGGVHYTMRMNDEAYKGGRSLKDNDVIHVYTEDGNEIALIVKYVSSFFHSYEKFSLSGVNQVTVGEQSENDISYNYMKLVSPQHAVFERSGSGFKIIDKSKNGTYVNSIRIKKECQLEFGSYIDVMGLRMVFLTDCLAVDVKGSDASVNEKKLRRWRRLDGKATLKVAEDALSFGKVLYHRAPRVLKEAMEEAVEIEAPPQMNQQKPPSLMMTIGPSLTMALPMILGCMMMVSSSAGGSALSMYSGLAMSVMSAAVGVFWAMQSVRQQKKEEEEQKKLRFDRYGAYLVEKTNEIKERYESVTRDLFEMYPGAAECLNYDEGRGILWSRNHMHSDFLKHRLGLGTVSFPITIQAPKKKFTLYADELEEKPRFIKENYEKLYDVPVVLDLSQQRLIGIIGGADRTGAIASAKLIASQIAANNCYTDVKMGFIYNGGTSNEEKDWRFAKWLPHVWSEDKKTRYMASDAVQASDVFYELTKVFRGRAEERKEKGDAKQMPKPYYVLFISDPSMLEGELISKYIFEKDEAYGLTAVILTERYEDLPNACDFIIENTQEFQGMYAVYAKEGQRQEIAFDQIRDCELEAFARHLSTLQVREMEQGGEIPNALTFFEMLDVAGPKEIPVKELWAKNRTYENMKGLVGVKAGGAPCYLDVHEKYHGPHGLVAGTTGSGKSETLQTYMLSLAVNYSPDDIGFFIIDYKGGGMANLFDGLPHMVGAISNLSGNQVKRAMISIKSENRRRQRVFSENGVNNINLYTKLYKNGEAALPVPHLFIIIDEFAELKREEPDFMRELISVAQVGRSLGVHMILATQKPSGTVDDNIWSNSKFRLCLRVQDKQDSLDMLHKPDAAYITQAGRCYLQVGSDEVYELFQSGYSGAAYEENAETGNVEIAKLLNLSGKIELTGNSVKLSRKKKTEIMWIEQLISCVDAAQKALGLRASEAAFDQEKMQKLISCIYEQMEGHSIDYAVNSYNSDRLIDFVKLYAQALEGGQEEAGVGAAKELLDRSIEEKVKLPQRKEKTQLDAVKEYLSEIAQECGYHYHMQLWMPVLPDHIYLDEFEEHCRSGYQKGQWAECKGPWNLEVLIGKVDDPENQSQMPLSVDFAKNGHLAIIGNVVSGKSTLMQTMAYALIQKYSPQAVHLYALDFSSKMMSAFEGAPHVGGVMYETDLEKISKFFHMIKEVLEERKALFRGGNYSQYVQMHGVTLPAIVIMIDNYGSFKEKTEEAYEDAVIALSREGVSHGIFLVVSGGGVGIDDITSRVSENISASLCLQLQERFSYIDFLHTNQIDVLPENGVKGRGLADCEGRVLEYQAALCVRAENDYQRMEKIRVRCEEMQRAWEGKAARKIPEIPKNPVWSKFHSLEEYERMRASRHLLPVAYDAKSAKIYGINLRQAYCYMAYGLARSGKTNFLKVCVQSAMEKGGQICVIDNEARDFGCYEEEPLCYVSDVEGAFQFFEKLLPVFQERNVKKWEMIREDCMEEEIMDVMEQEEPYFIFIADLGEFVQWINDTEYDMKDFLINILSKGRLHHIYFFSAISLSDHALYVGDGLYDAFTGHKTGVHFGRDADSNPMLEFEYAPYAEHTKAEAPGIGYLPDVASNADTAKIVVPLARK